LNQENTMPRNYDTTSGLPYPRVCRIVIDHHEDGTSTVTYEERTAIVDAGGAVRLLDGRPEVRMLPLPAPTHPVGYVNPATGAQIPGSTTVQQMLMGITAICRRGQMLLDGEADPLQPLP
jgi:hypothetical protein